MEIRPIPGRWFLPKDSYYSTRLPSLVRVTLIPDSPMHLQWFFFSLFSLHPTATKKKWRSYCLPEAIMALLVKSFAILCVHAPSVKNYAPGTHCSSNWAFSLTWLASIQINWNEREGLHKKKKNTGLVWNTNMRATVSLFWNTNMAAVTSCENALKAISELPPASVSKRG